VCCESHGPQKIGAGEPIHVLTLLGLRYYQQIVAIAAAVLESCVNSIGDRAAAGYAPGRREVVRDLMTTPNPETM
jgi:hypothetical protein